MKGICCLAGSMMINKPHLMRMQLIKSFLFLCWMVLAVTAAPAQVSLAPQKEKKETRIGNSQFEKQNYTDAESSYKKALDIKNNMPEATFNLGDAVYEQKRYDEAGKQFQLSAQTHADAQVKAKAYHNLGNSFLQQKKYEDAVMAYKDALKLNPQDQDTKYNLAYANAMLQKQNNGGQNQQKNQDQNKQDQKQDQQKDQQQNQDQQNKQQNQQQPNQQSQQDQQKAQQQPKLSKEEAEQLLQALANEEQKTTQKMQQKNMKAVRVKTKKDW